MQTHQLRQALNTRDSLCIPTPWPYRVGQTTRLCGDMHMMPEIYLHTLLSFPGISNVTDSTLYFT